MTKTWARCLLIMLIAAPFAAADQGEKSFEVYGFAQVDYIQDFNRVDPNWAATLRPSKIPTTKGADGSDGQAIVSARQSRLGAQGTIPTSDGDVFGKVEFDFYGVGPDEGQTTIRLRHAYGQWNQFLGGQTNSLFMDVDIFPNVIDYWGPSGMVFLRNPQLRWTPISGGDRTFAVAVEHPNNDVDPGQLQQVDPSLGNVTSVSKIPDFTAQFRQDGGFGHVQLAGILRRLGFETLNTPGNRPSGSDVGWGLDLTSNIKTIGKDVIHAGAVYGNGIANYMNDGGTDLAAQRDGTTADSAAVPLVGVLAYYDHWWSEKFSSSFGYSRTQVQNTDLQTADAFHSGQYVSLNLIYYPTTNVFFGGEYLWGQRRDSGGAIGIDNRIQVSMNYKFSSKNVFGK